MYRYYLTQRPPSIGTFPSHKDNTPFVHGFSVGRKYVEEIKHEAWGYVEYEKPLTAKQIEEYELVEGV